MSEGTLDASKRVYVCKPLREDYPWKEMIGVASASASVGNNLDSAEPTDAPGKKANSYLKDSFSDYWYIEDRAYFPRRQVESTMKAMASERASKGREQLAAACAAEVAAVAAETGDVAVAVQRHLTE
ncbi:MAG: hypothetical protein H0W72_18100, partial [Planctomycetes bacterium]|nr:hypothetical protein [Planctomycetota bacterium]